MNNELFERLLYEEESTTLDFKKEQYRFVKATDDDKSELLKDILGFANAWRRSDAYILVGVDDVRGGRSDVVGIPAADHLNDHSLQQFVNNLTNQPVRFRYEAFGFEGKQVGIICIEEQTRPIYLKRDYGKLKKQEVYVRRGSSTDPTKPASLEEVAQMRVGAGHPAAELVVEFADVQRDDSLGTGMAWDAELCAMPDMETIPEWERPRQRNPFGIDLSPVMFDPMNQPNGNYYRDLANYEFTRRLFRPVRLVVKNVGQVAANNVRAELTVPTNIGVMVVYKSDLPDPPRRRREIMSAAMKGFRPALRRDPGEVTIDKNDERFRVEIDCRDLQPGRRVWSDIFYVGKGQSGDVTLSGQVFADNLPQPKDFTLSVSVTVAETSLSVDDLCSLPEPTEEED
jgi:hypothetical protein